MKSLAGLPWKLGAHTVLAPPIALKGSFPAPFWSVSTGPITLFLGSRCLFFFFFLWRMQWFVLPQFTKAWRVIEKGTNTNEAALDLEPHCGWSSTCVTSLNPHYKTVTLSSPDRRPRTELAKTDRPLTLLPASWVNLSTVSNFSELQFVYF